jgi:hypothetical protein
MFMYRVRESPGEGLTSQEPPDEGSSCTGQGSPCEGTTLIYICKYIYVICIYLYDSYV